MSAKEGVSGRAEQGAGKRPTVQLVRELADGLGGDLLQVRHEDTVLHGARRLDLRRGERASAFGDDDRGLCSLTVLKTTMPTRSLGQLMTLRFIMAKAALKVSSSLLLALPPVEPPLPL